MKRCKDCYWDKYIEEKDYCGKHRNRGGPCDYDYCLPKKTYNENGMCLDYIKKRWWHRFWRSK